MPVAQGPGYARMPACPRALLRAAPVNVAADDRVLLLARPPLTLVPCSLVGDYGFDPLFLSGTPEMKKW